MGDIGRQGLSTHRVAKELKEFGLATKRDQLKGETVRGWWRVDLEPVWERYLSPDGEPERAEKRRIGHFSSSKCRSVGIGRFSAQPSRF